MRLFLIFLSISMIVSSAKGQSWSPETLSAANTAINTPYLNQEEKDMIFYVNLVRLDGELFFKTYFKAYVERNNIDMRQYSNYKELMIDKKSSYYRSLENDLKKIKGLPVLFPDEKLTKVALGHANDLNKNNLVSHNSSNGQSFVQRVSKVYTNRSMAENLSFGNITGLDIVCALLLDQNIPDLGHRLNILNSSSKFTHIGVAIAPHPYYRKCAVMDFVALNKDLTL